VKGTRWILGLGVGLGLAHGLAWPAAAGADEELAPASGGALAVQADPPRLVLGGDAGAELRIAAPPEVDELSVTCNAGKVEAVRRLPGGGFTARYKAPPERYPQVAIVSAVGRGAAGAVDGWLAIPLSGQGDARVDGEPGSRVTLRIGGRLFGPAPVGADGFALVPVIVPPGLREGHVGFHARELEVPETSLVHAALDRQAVLADRAEALRVLVYVVAPHGAARRGDPPVVEASRGTVALRPREVGAWEGSWTLPPGPPGEERLTVRLPGQPASREALKVAVGPGPAASVILGLDRTTLVAGQADEVRVTARGYDAAGNPSPSPIALSADAGALSRPEEAGSGEVRAVLRVPPRFAGRGKVLVEARLGGGGASTSRVVSLAPGPAAHMTLSPGSGGVRADGRAEVVLTLEVRDRFDNPVADPPRLESSWGAPPALEPAGPGCWSVRYRPQAVVERRTVHLTAALQDASADAGLLLSPSPARQVSAFAGGGGTAALSEGAAGGHLLLGAELPAPDVLSPGAAAAAWRLELVGLAIGGGDGRRTAAAILAGPVLKESLAALRWYAGATAGVLLDQALDPGRRRAGLGLAGRLLLGVTLPRRGAAAPFLELGLLGGAGSPGGSFGALQLTLGVRLDLYRDADGRGE
jgi:hypothetical protein